jgi:CheY-like chemotaxis protein
MMKPLSDALILVADDQIDVARTLCVPLKRAGATLRYAVGAREALSDIEHLPVDLLLVDMKMPPGEWGGLWLLRAMQTAGWAIPAVALSGEGSKRQVIEAQRLGALSWVDKDQAGEELLGQCVTILNSSHAQALDLAIARLPTLIAHRFAQYVQIIDAEKKINAGVHTLEAVLQFLALIGLCSTPPQPLSNITRDQMRSPSMRTWLELCTSLAFAPSAGDAFLRMVRCLIPDAAHRQLLHELITHRNDVAHGRSMPDSIRGEHLDALLRRFAHRAQSWRSEIAVPLSMTFDGSRFLVEVLRLKGIATPAPSVFESEKAVVTDQLILLSPQSDPLPLSPWIVANGTEGSSKPACFLYDGVQRTQGVLELDTPLKYSKAYDGSDLGAAFIQAGATWESVAPWIASSVAQ